MNVGSYVERVCRPTDDTPHTLKPDVYLVDRLISLYTHLKENNIPVPKYISLVPFSTPFAES